MMITGVDYHPSFQQVAFLIQETVECGERQLNHEDGEAERFIRDLKQRGISMRVGTEATGYSRWFERLLAELGFQVWIGDPTEMKTRRVKKRKTDRKDAGLLLNLLTKILGNGLSQKEKNCAVTTGSQQDRPRGL